MRSKVKLSGEESDTESLERPPSSGQVIHCGAVAVQTAQGNKEEEVAELEGP